MDLFGYGNKDYSSSVNNNQPLDGRRSQTKTSIRSARMYGDCKGPPQPPARNRSVSFRSRSTPPQKKKSFRQLFGFQALANGVEYLENIMRMSERQKEEERRRVRRTSFDRLEDRHDSGRRSSIINLDSVNGDKSDFRFKTNSDSPVSRNGSPIAKNFKLNHKLSFQLKNPSNNPASRLESYSELKETMLSEKYGKLPSESVSRRDITARIMEESIEHKGLRSLVRRLSDEASVAEHSSNANAAEQSTSKRNIQSARGSDPPGQFEVMSQGSDPRPYNMQDREITSNDIGKLADRLRQDIQDLIDLERRLRGESYDQDRRRSKSSSRSPVPRLPNRSDRASNRSLSSMSTNKGENQPSCFAACCGCATEPPPSSESGRRSNGSSGRNEAQRTGSVGINEPRNYGSDGGGGAESPRNFGSSGINEPPNFGGGGGGFGGGGRPDPLVVATHGPRNEARNFGGGATTARCEVKNDGYSKPTRPCKCKHPPNRDRKPHSPLKPAINIQPERSNTHEEKKNVNKSYNEPKRRNSSPPKQPKEVNYVTPRTIEKNTEEVKKFDSPSRDSADSKAIQALKFNKLDVIKKPIIEKRPSEERQTPLPAYKPKPNPISSEQDDMMLQVRVRIHPIENPQSYTSTESTDSRPDNEDRRRKHDYLKPHTISSDDMDSNVVVVDVPKFIGRRDGSLAKGEDQARQRLAESLSKSIVKAVADIKKNPAPAMGGRSRQRNMQNANTIRPDLKDRSNYDQIRQEQYKHIYHAIASSSRNRDSSSRHRDSSSRHRDSSRRSHNHHTNRRLDCNRANNFPSGISSLEQSLMTNSQTYCRTIDPDSNIDQQAVGTGPSDIMIDGQKFHISFECTDRESESLSSRNSEWRNSDVLNQTTTTTECYENSRDSAGNSLTQTQSTYQGTLCRPSSVVGSKFDLYPRFADLCPSDDKCVQVEEI